jgi:amino acid adenylation domain-containing protein
MEVQILAPQLDSFARVLACTAAEGGERTAYSYLGDGDCETGSLTYRELHNRALGIARELGARGLKGERALLLFQSGLDFISAFFGCLYAGTIPVPSQYPARPRHLPRVAGIVADCAPQVLLTEASSVPRLEELIRRSAFPGLSALQRLATDVIELEEREEWRPLRPLPEIAFLQYTSGSTAEPKGVVVTHSNLLHNQEMIRQAFGQDGSSVVAGWLPLYHDMGLIGNVLQPLYVGAHCILMPPAAFLQKPLRWLAAVSRYRATTSGGPNFAYDLCVRRIAEEDLADLDLATWRVAFNGAEPVRAETMAAFSRKFASCNFRSEAFYPCYGLAEATLFVTGGAPVIRRVSRTALEEGRVCVDTDEAVPAAVLVGCGRSWGDEQVRIFNPETGVECRPDQIGEIWITGSNVTQGYWNRESECCPTLRTGDLGFILEGNLYVTGRLKDLIIVRGRNLYPQDLELTAGQSHVDLEPGAGAAFSIESDGQEELVIVHELRRGSDAPADEISAAIRQSIAAEYEVSVCDVVLLKPGELPRTTSGKVRRAFCRAQYLAGEPKSFRSEAVPVQPNELTALVARILRLLPDSVPADASLTSLGLDSLKAIELAHELGVTPALLLDGISIRELTAQVPPAPAPLRDSRGSETLTPGQRALYALECLARPTSPNNIFAAGWVDGDVDTGALRRALNRIAERHTALRTTFRADAAVIHAELLPDLVEWTVDGADALVHEAERSFDLEHGALLRVRLCRFPDGRSALLLSTHHLVADLWSLEIILQELGAIYAEELGGAPAKLSLAAPFSRFVDWQTEWLTSPAAEQARSYWREQVAELPLLDLPADRARPAVQTFRGAVERASIPPGVLESARSIARTQSVTLYTLLLTAFQAALHRFTGQSDIVIGSPVLGRPLQEFARSVGCFVNPLPFRVTFEDNPSFTTLLTRNRESVRNALAHSNLPGAAIAPDLFRAFIVFEQSHLRGLENLPAFALGEPGASIQVGPLRLTSLAMDRSTAQFDLLLYAAELNGGLRLALEYNTDLFDPFTARSILECMTALMESAVRTPEVRVGDLEIVTGWDVPPAPAKVQRCLHELFEERAHASPHAPAVVHGLEEITYAELNARSNRLAATLAARGVGPDVRVPLFFEPGIPMIVAILGVLKAGGAYVPLDPHQPSERLEYIAGDAVASGSCRLLVTEPPLLERASSMAAVLSLDLLVPETVAEDSFPARAPVHPDNAAYIIYTSGSTGRPKGVINTHANVVRLFEQTDSNFQFSAGDVWTMFHSYSFDFSVWEIWGALLYGGRVVIVPYCTSRSAQQFYQLLRSEGVTILSQTPSAFRQLAALPEPWGERYGFRLRAVVFGGEALELNGLRTWFEQYEGKRPSMVNMYGITETTVHVTYCALSGRDISSCSRSLIGKPISDLQVYLLDSRMQLVPQGAIGEMYVGGEGLARGYLARPALTAERFVPNPFSPSPGQRLYRSGDLGRCLPDGNLEYLGRIDHQVKIRGHRIELGEVQYAISQHPAVRQVLVLARPDRHGETQLVAYVAAGGMHQEIATSLRAFLANRLPPYMTPAVFVALDSFPLTGNGKIDRRALPPPEMADTGRPNQEARALTRSEAALAMIWTELLGRADPQPEDSFFDLGGHSLLATRMIKRVRDVFGVDLPVAGIFATPMLADLAQAIDGLRSHAASGAIPVSPDRREFPLSFAQERIWMAEQLMPGTPLFHIPIALEIGGRLDHSILQLCIQRLVDRHEILRTYYVLEGTEPVQRVSPEIDIRVPLVDLSSIPGAAPGPIIRDETAEPFDLENPPLFRTKLFRLSEEKHVLFLNLHHILSDLWSAGILVEEFLRLYAAISKGLPDPLSPLRIQYGDFALWERAQAAEGRFDSQVAFRRDKLSGGEPDFEIPTDRPRPAAASIRGAIARSVLPKDLAEALHALRRQQGVTLYSLLLTAFKVLLTHYSRSTDILVGTDVAVREPHDVQPLVGLFVNQVTLCTCLDGNPSFEEALRRVRDETTKAWANYSAPLQRGPLFRILFDFQTYNLPSVPETGLAITRLDTDWNTAKYDLSLFMEEENGNLRATLEYNTDLFTETSARRLLAHYRTVLEQATRDPGKSIESFALLEEPAQRKLAAAFNEDLELV